MTAKCPVCDKDCKNPQNLASHLGAKHPDYFRDEPKKPARLAKTTPKKKTGGPKRKYATDEEAYAAQKANAAAASARKTLAGREIGPLPAVADPARRARCERSLLAYCQTYHPANFYLPFSSAHYKAIAKAERAVLHGGVFALAMPRGSGKSMICKRAAEWAILYGHRRFVVLVGATGPAADALMVDIQNTLETIDLILADFPEAAYPVRRLDRLPFKARGQLLGGVSTRLVWKTDFLTLAHIPGSVCAGATITTVGIEANMRGLLVPGPDGGSIRPDMVIVDDPQTRESATSLTQVEKRLSIVNGDVLGLAGPSKTIACLLPCTVISPDDVADRLLNRAVSPKWQGERTKMVDAFPSAEGLWEEYFRIRDQELRTDGDGKLARAYYLSHQEEMDEGCVLSWPDRYDPAAYASAVEEAMCYRHDRPEAFAAEAQNEPLLAAEIAAGSLTLTGLKEKANAVPQGTVPRESVHLTAGIDVGKDILFWSVTAWTEDGGGAVVDYGTFPRQNQSHFTARDARQTLGSLFPQMDEQARVYAGLKALTEQLFGKEWAREGGGHLRMDRGLIDSGWNTELVKRFCRQSQYATMLFPSKGFGITATAAPMGSWAKKPGQKWWNRYCMLNLDRLVNFDSNYWKSQVVNRLLTPPAGRACLYVPAGDHSHFFEHLASEYRVTATADKQGRKVDEWKLKPGRPDNHWLDALVLSSVAAVTLGVKYDAQKAAAQAATAGDPSPAVPAAAPKAKKARRSLGEMLRERRDAQGDYSWTS